MSEYQSTGDSGSSISFSKCPKLFPWAKGSVTHSTPSCSRAIPANRSSHSCETMLSLMKLITMYFSGRPNLFSISSFEGRMPAAFCEKAKTGSGVTSGFRRPLVIWTIILCVHSSRTER